MENIKQTARMPVWRIMKARTPEEFLPELKAIATDTFENEADREQARADLFARLPADMRKELTHFGVVLPTDGVDLTVSLGSFLFDMFCCAEKAPTAPLARLVHQKKLMDVASALNAQFIEVPEVATLSIKQTMLNDKAWNDAIFVSSLTIPAKEGADPTSVEVVLKSNAAGSFGNIVQAAAELMHGTK